MRDGGKPGRPRGSRTGRPDADVVKIYGLRAAQAVLAHRPSAVVRGYISEARRDLGPAMRTLAKARIAYRVIPEKEVDRVAQSQHHEGLCLLVKPAEPPAMDVWARELPPAAMVVILDGIRNPHNLGAIVRSAAHFGIRGVWVLGAPTPVHGAMARVAEGATESVPVFHEPHLGRTLTTLVRVGFQVVGGTPQSPRSVFEHRFARRTALVLGSERSGLSSAVASFLERELSIPGTGAIESLNVASAAAVILGEYARQRSQRATQRVSDPVAE